MVLTYEIKNRNNTGWEEPKSSESNGPAHFRKQVPSGSTSLPSTGRPGEPPPRGGSPPRAYQHQQVGHHDVIGLRAVGQGRLEVVAPVFQEGEGPVVVESDVVLISVLPGRETTGCVCVLVSKQIAQTSGEPRWRREQKRTSGGRLSLRWCFYLLPNSERDGPVTFLQTTHTQTS